MRFTETKFIICLTCGESKRAGRKRHRVGGLKIALPVNVDSIPEEMKALENWLLWKYEDRKDSKGNIKKTKIPYQVNGKKAESTNPETWGSFENVIKTLDRFPDKFDGVGFAFSEDSGIMGLDFDHVKNPETGEWDPEAIKEIKSINSYTEMSPSGTGAHVICIAKIPGPHRREGPREMYESGRYFTVTGDYIQGTSQTVSEAQGAVNALYYNWFNHRDKKAAAGSKKQPEKKTEKKIILSDSEIIDIASRAKNSDKFKSLFNGNIAGYPSQSEADQALCSLVAFYTQDTGQIDSIFRGSGLYRADKWEVANYRDRTINKALQGVTETYNPEKKGKSSKGKPEKILVHWDEVGDRILKENHIFSMRDNGQIYLYKDGVYRSEGTEAILGTRIRDAYYLMYKEKWKDVNTDFDLPEHIPKATVRYVNEVLAYIRAYTHIPRELIDAYQEKYINFKNRLFNLDKREFEDHNPGIKTICQIPVNYDSKAECPQIKKFLQDVANPEDIAFLEEWAGYCLTTDVSYQKALMIYGIPGTGKSVFATMLETFIGGENASSESLQKIEEDKYRAAKLYGKRVNICSDIPSTKMHKTEVFKKLVSGLDTIDAENKYQDPFKFKNKAKLTFSANKIPEGPKDPAFYERFCLIEFGNKFRGTDKDDKRLIRNLTADAELSGFLNVALEGLKRLYENDKFSYNKTFEETEREYILNSNPVAFFMEKCTAISDQDIESTHLYLSYVDWSTQNNKPRVSNIEFSRRLNKMGYTSHRENVKSDGSKKATFWDNLRLKTPKEISKDDEKENKKDDFGQDLGQDQNNRSCPKKSSQPITENLAENGSGQDLTPCVDFTAQNNLFDCDNIETVKAAKIGENENTPNELKRSCPSVWVFDSGEYGQDVSKHPVLDPVREQKTLIFEQNGETDIMKNLTSCELMRNDLKNFARSRYNLVVDSIPVFVGEFNKKYPGYKQDYGLQAVLDNAERLSSRGWT